MSAAIDLNAIKQLPEETQAQIAKLLLKSKRKYLNQQKLKLVVRRTPDSHAVEFFRVSSTAQREGYSLVAQEEKAQEYLKSQNLEAVKTWSVSESASKEFDRKKFFEMVNYVSTQGIKNVIFDKIDRACRGLRAAVMIEDLIESGVRFHFVRDNLIVDKDSSPSEKLRFYLGVILAKHYIDNLTSDIKKGLKRRLDEGYFNAKAPVGYVNYRPEAGRANLKIHAQLGPFMSECFELYKTGNYSRKDLERIGIERGITWERKRKVYGEDGSVKMERYEANVTDKTLEKALSNPTYCQARWVGRKLEIVDNCKWEALTSVETFKACQKIKGIRAKQSQMRLSGTISKPLMQMMRCGVCNHQVTGEIKKKSTGKIYIYYRCADRKCAQSRINTEQKKLFKQLNEAMMPFGRLTPKATTSFISGLKGSLEDINVYSLDSVSELRETQQKLKARLKEVDKLSKKGLLSASEKETLVEIKENELEETELQIESHLKANRQTLETGLKIIELLGNSSKFMQLEGYELQKARLAKSLLSNLTLKDGTIEFSYSKPFDDITNLLTGRNWWRWRESNPRPNTR